MSKLSEELKIYGQLIITQSPSIIACLARAAQYSYYDHCFRYEKWKKNREAYPSPFEALFKSMKSKEIKIDFADRELGYYLTAIETSNEILIIFPGTRKNIKGLRDLGTDLFVILNQKYFYDCDFDLTLTETHFFGFECKVHRGFFERYKLLRTEIHNVLLNEKFVKSGKPLTLVGHSLGGVLAIMASEGLHILQYQTNALFYTYSD